MANQSVRPPYGSVEAHVERLRPYAPHDANIYACAFGIVEGLVTTLRLDTPAEQLRYVRNVVTAVNQVRGEGDADPTRLAYSRADEADDPTPVSGARVEMHTGAVTEDGLIEDPPCDHRQPCGRIECQVGDGY